VAALRTLLQPDLWLRPEPDAPPPLLDAIQSSRKGQAELSKVLGERVREAVEVLVSGHGEALKKRCPDVESADIYRAAVRVVMRLVVTLFAESRELLPRDSALYHGSYGLSGLLEELEKSAARGRSRLRSSISAWPRILALFRLIHQGSHHPDLPVPAYGGELFGPGNPESPDGMSRALSAFETTCFDQQHRALSDTEVYTILEHITRTKVKVRQGRASTWVPVPVDFSDLSSEYIGILYEGLLDFELKTAPADDPVVFLAVGDQPALTLSRLEAMDDKALKDLLEKLKDTSKDDGEQAEEEEVPEEEAGDEAAEEGAADEDEPSAEEEATGDDLRQSVRTRAESWAKRAVEIGKLVKKPRGTMTPERKAAYDEVVTRKARQIIVRAVMPGEWYLARWGGTRKGSGTFYTRPGLAVPTVHRTLRPLLYEDSQGSEDVRPKLPEQILKLKILDPACGSGTFPVAALRYVTDALYASLLIHGRISEEGDRSMVALLKGNGGGEELLQDEMVPCLKDDEQFEPRLKAVLRRHVVERCIYGVDLDPIAVELCRLALWVETMDRTLPFSFLDHKIKCGNGIVGTWLDTFEHYPVMAWKNREGGDKGHSNGVHFKKGESAKVYKSWVKDQVIPDMLRAFSGQMTIGKSTVENPAAVQERLIESVRKLHEIPVRNADERAKLFRDEIVGSDTYWEIKSAMDLWCACWFWPASEINLAPLPSEFFRPREESVDVARRISAGRRFFHWEIEFPDVFCSLKTGFDAVLGNPPWETLQPNSKEFFSNVDPLYRAYGKQEALRCQTEFFSDRALEEDWISYNAGYADDSNWMKHVGNPFGDPEVTDKGPEKFALGRGSSSAELHLRWRKLRRTRTGFADPIHPFVHRGEGKAYTYKLFLEQAHALLRQGGRLGFIVPSGLYSDYGASALRSLFLERCKWEWIFGFENREGIFDIHRSFKFNPIIVQKSGTTQAINAAFMRRRLEDWERGEMFATPYTMERVGQFSPKSKTILEIQSGRDLEILEKIYSNSVLLGGDGPNGWGLKYAQGDFNMTSDSKLFPPRSKWEADGFRPDEYSRWLRGDWKPVKQLWAEMGIDPGNPEPLDRECEVLLREADVIRGEHPLRCAQPPYNRIPVPRANIPEGIILSRGADSFIREVDIEGMALPLYQGVGIWQLNSLAADFVSGANHSARWEHRSIYSSGLPTPQFAISPSKASSKSTASLAARIGFRAIQNATNQRTMISTILPGVPTGNSVGTLTAESGIYLSLPVFLCDFAYDFALRPRMSQANLNWFVLEETPVPSPMLLSRTFTLSQMSVGLSGPSPAFAPLWMGLLADRSTAWKRRWGVTSHERLRMRSACDAVALYIRGLSEDDLKVVFKDCDHPKEVYEDRDFRSSLYVKGFWRVDRTRDVQLRHTILTQIAYHDLKRKLGPQDQLSDGVVAAVEESKFLNEWKLPERVRLQDYGIGRDSSCNENLEVASILGPQFDDWQLGQSEDESIRECRLHCRNLLGPDWEQSISMGVGQVGPARPDSDEIPVRSERETDQQGSLFFDKEK
jgi:hypothetical protein